MTLEVYIVIKTGVYRHDIVGVWLDRQAACAGARVACLADKDDYHHYEVISMEIGGSRETPVCEFQRRDKYPEGFFEGCAGGVQPLKTITVTGPGAVFANG